MEQTTTVGFHVSGEFITNLARTWFWDEHKPTKTCMELITCCCDDTELTPYEKTDIARSILEGRKKFVGTDVFTLEDDNEHIRPITDKIIADERRAKIEQIRLDMIANFRKYVDIYATIKSSHIDALSVNGMPNTFQECREYYTMQMTDSGYFEEIPIRETTLIDSPTMGGLWLIHEPELVHDACNGDLSLIGKDEFWRNIYEYIKDNPDFKDRNERYLFAIRPKPSYEERMKALTKSYQETQDTLQEPEHNTPAWFQYKFQQTKECQYDMLPDDVKNWEGLIAPNGDFYSVEFGSHNIKAYYLLLTYHDKFHHTKEYFQENTRIRLDNALDYLIEHGWCATRSVMYDQYILPPIPAKPTKAQINTILYAIEKHGAKINTDELISYL